MNDESAEVHETTLSLEELRALRDAIEKRGEGPFAIVACVHRATVGRALAGLPLRRGSVVLIRLALVQAGFLK